MTLRLYQYILWLLWFLLFALLPLTSYPWVSRAAGMSSVAPASGVVLIILAVVWFLPYLIRRGRLLTQSLPLILFVGAAIISSAAAFYISVPPFRDYHILRSEFKALATLLVGVLFFIIVSSWAVEERRLRFALRVINFSGFILILWSLAQAYYWRQLSGYPQWMWDFQETISIGRLYEFRVTGFALEPSWLAHQLNMLYLPFWLAATVSGTSAHRYKLWKISLENVLLVFGVLVLYISLSRVGLLAFLLMIAFLFLVANIKLIQWILKRISRGNHGSTSVAHLKRIVITAILMIALLVLYASLLIGIGYSLSKVDYRMARLFDVSFLKETSFIKYANQLVIAERLVFWQAGLGIFNRFSLLGVGLGNAGFFFSKELSAYAWALTEVRLVMYHLSSLPNIKSLWVRILAETGLVGFSLFIGWCYTLWISALHLRVSPGKFFRLFGWSGGFVLVGLIVEGFSIDSFALPYFWISLGLLAGAFRQSVNNSDAVK